MEEVSMNSTALGAKKENINFISEAHEKFYYEKIQKVREADVYHKALCYCLGMNEDRKLTFHLVIDIYRQRQS